MITRMRKLLLAGKKPLLPELLAFIQGEGVFQVEQLNEDGLSPYRDPQEINRSLPPLEKELGRLDALLLLLPRKTAIPSPSPPVALDVLEQEIVGIRSRLSQLEEEKRFLATYQKALCVLLPLLSALQTSPRLEALGFLSLPRERVNLAKLQSALEKELAGRIEWISQAVEEGLSAQVIAYPKNDASFIRAALQQHGFSELRLPDKSEDLPAVDRVKRMTQRLAELPEEIGSLSRQLAHIAGEQRVNLEQAKAQLLDQIELEKALQIAGRSHFAFFLSGWIPTQRVSLFRSRLEQAFSGQVTLQLLETSEHELQQAPVLLQNKPIFQPFELLLSVFQPPRYDRIDPTPIVGFFFPLFFGLIIGDIGYGLLFLIPLLFLFFRSKPGTLRSVAQIGIICSAWTILFGVLFGEFFGTFGVAFGIHPLLINRETQLGILAFLLISLAIGVVQIFLGFILEIVMSLRERAYREAIEAGSLLGWILGLLLALLAVIGLLPSLFLYFGLGLLGIGWIGVIATKGPIIGITEPLSTTGNILSYSRLMGIGVASAYLAFAANQIGGLMGNPVIGFIVGAICHLLFLILGIISPIIQSARLHFVEFFSKFKYHEYSGNPYKPLAKAIQKGA